MYPAHRSRYHGDRPVAAPEEFLRSLEVEGYAVWPGVLPLALLQRLQQQIATYETAPRDYSSRQRGVALAGPVPFIDATLQTHDDGPNALAGLIAHPPTVNKLAHIFGGDTPPVFVSFSYDISCIGTPGISLHTDMQPYGSTLFGGSLFSSPQLVRVLYYLDDLTLDVSPFRCIPRSRERGPSCRPARQHLLERSAKCNQVERALIQLQWCCRPIDARRCKSIHTLHGAPRCLSSTADSSPTASRCATARVCVKP